MGYLATSNAKSDVGFLLGDPDFLFGRRNFGPILLSYRDPYLGHLEFWVFSYFRRKIRRHILALWPWFPCKSDEISRLPRLIFEIWRGTDQGHTMIFRPWDRHCQTDDRQTDAAAETEGFHTVGPKYTSLITYAFLHIGSTLIHNLNGTFSDWR